MRLLLLAIFFVLLAYPCYSIVISEIMYDPSGNDNYDEWIEIYNEGNSSISLENWTLCNVSVLPGYINHEDGLSHNDLGYELQPSSFAVITDGGSGTLAYSHYNIEGNAFHTKLSSLCGELSNTNDYINLSNTSFSVSASYNSSIGGSGNNKTICRYPETNDTFQECLPTPGALNKKPINVSVLVLKNYINLTSEACEALPIEFTYNITNNTYYFSDFYAGNLSCSLWIPLPVENGEWTVCWNLKSPYENLSACSETGIYNVSESCAIALSVDSPQIVNISQTFQYFININETSCYMNNITIEYWIEDMSGEFAKSMTNTTQSFSCFKSISREWTPEEGGAYIIRARSYPCLSEAFGIVAVKEKGKQNDSSIEIKDYAESVKFGEILHTNLLLYRGSTDKYALEVWTEINGKKSSEVTSFHLSKKYTSYELQIPVQIKPNCDSNLPEGNHTLVVSGLGLTETMPVAINASSSLCHTVTIHESSSSGSGSVSATSMASSPITSTTETSILSYNESALEGDEIETEINVSNPLGKTISLYSYIFKGSFLASEGGWMPNEMSSNISGSRNLTLQNRIKDGIPEGVYYLRVRAKSDNKTYDKTVEITISKKPPVPTETAAEENNSITIQKDVSIPVTGMAFENPVALKTKPLFEYAINYRFIPVIKRFLHLQS